MSESFAELFEESLKTIDMNSGSIITGVVVDIDSEWVTVHAGLKSEGVSPRSQFLSESGELEVEIGDTVQVSMDAVDDGFGETRLSREKAKRAEAWQMLENVYEAQEVIKGTISGRVKGGFTVEIRDVRAFLPGSLVDVRPLRENEQLEGQELEFKVIKLDQKRNNVVVSRRSVLEEENSAEREALLESLQEGQEVKGIVKNLTDYGAFVDPLSICCLIKSPMVVGLTSASFSRCSFTAVSSSAISFALMETPNIRFLRSTLMIFTSISSPTLIAFLASSTWSMLISDAFRIPSTSSANSRVACLASTSFTLPLTIAPRSFTAT